MKLNLRLSENGRALAHRRATQKCMKDFADGKRYEQALLGYLIRLDNLNKVCGRNSLWDEAVMNIINYRSYKKAVNAMNEISKLYA